MNDREKLRFLRKKIKKLNNKAYHLQKSIDKERDDYMFSDSLFSSPENHLIY